MQKLTTGQGDDRTQRLHKLKTNKHFQDANISLAQMSNLSPTAFQEDLLYFKDISTGVGTKILNHHIVSNKDVSICFLCKCYNNRLMTEL